jgi:thiol-disulfide isomerase/thioredoxin
MLNQLNHPPQITTTTGTSGTNGGGIKDVANSSELSSLITANSGKLIVLKSYMDTCPVCKAYAPTFSQFPSQYPTVIFAQYNAGRPSDLTTKLGLATVPATTLYISNTTPLTQIAGIQFWVHL